MACQCLLAVMTAVSLALLTYAALQWDLPLPSFDVTDYDRFLVDAATGPIPWDWLWQRHNGLHCIVLPKLVWVLDIRLGQGRGDITRAVAAALVLATALTVAWQVLRLSLLAAAERRLLAGLALLVLTSIFLAESLLSPINIQWAFLALGVVLLASGLDALYRRQGWCGAALLVVGALMAGLSGGLPVLLLLAGLGALWLTWPPLQARQRGLLPALLCLPVLVLLWDQLAPYPSVLGLLYRDLLPADEWAQLDRAVHDNPLVYLGWLYPKLAFLGRFLLVPFGHPMQSQQLLVLAVLAWAVLLWRSRRHWQPQQVFFVYLCLFTALLGLAAAAARLHLAYYNYRHANLGFLLALSSLLLLYPAWQARRRVQWLALAVVLYGAACVPLVLREVRDWAYGGRIPLAEHAVGHALGIRDPQQFSWVWSMFPNPQDEPARRREDWQAAGIGVFATDGYRVFSGARALPVATVPCVHRLLLLERHTVDTRAFRLRGESLGPDGRAMTAALFMAGGQPVGYGVRVPAGEPLRVQWQQPWQWSGHLLAGEVPPAAVEVIAYDGQRRCQPWQVALPVSP